MLLDIDIDHSKCETPFDCKKCLQICPQAVFWVESVKIEKFKETDPKEPGAYRLSPLFLDKCVGCRDCVEVCPLDAIHITIPEDIKK